MTFDLSILIPARNEYYEEIDLLHHTVTNVLTNTSDATEIIVVEDGYSPPQPLPQSSRITVIHHSKSIGQRAACNEAARVSRAKFICKLDAHCAIGPEFDTRMMAQCDYDVTLIPTQFNLNVFNWKCKKCAHEQYQDGLKPHCTKCKSQYMKKAVKWQPRGWKERDGVWSGNPKNTAWYFDSELNFGYAPTQPPDANGLNETMSCLGACWMLQRERYWELEGMDTSYGSWGDMGSELSAKSWLSGGRMLTNHATWFAHFFRTGNFKFPYPGGGHKERAKARCKEIWLNNKWPKQVRPLSWLVEHFKPVKDWHSGNNQVLAQVNEAGDRFNQQRGLDAVMKASVSSPWVKPTDPTKTMLLYTCNSHDPTLELAARNNLLRSKNGYELGCVSRERTEFGDWNIVVNLPKSGATMHEQILAGLERARGDYVFLCESDVFYSSSHFDFTPCDDSTFYYNINVWRVRWSDGHAVRTANLQQVSGICASRKLLLAHYRRRVELIRANGGVFDTKRMAYEPGTRGRFGDEQVANWESPYPNIDITGHGQTLTTPHFSIDSFRNKKYAEGWQETDDEIAGWPKLSGGGLRQLLQELANERGAQSIS